MSPRKPPTVELADLEMGRKLGAWQPLCVDLSLQLCRRCAVPLTPAAAPALHLCTCPDATSPLPLSNALNKHRISPAPFPTAAAGDGASGEVFEARWRGQRVAVKIFVQDRSPDGHSRDEMAIAFAGEGLLLLGELERRRGEVVAGPSNDAACGPCNSCPSQPVSQSALLYCPTALPAALPHPPAPLHPHAFCSVGAAPGPGGSADAGPPGPGPRVCRGGTHR
jgi:hypothetical protein